MATFYSHDIAREITLAFNAYYGYCYLSLVIIMELEFYINLKHIFVLIYALILRDDFYRIMGDISATAINRLL